MKRVLQCLWWIFLGANLGCFFIGIYQNDMQHILVNGITVIIMLLLHCSLPTRKTLKEWQDLDKEN